MLVAVSAIFIAMRTLPNNPIVARYGERVRAAEIQTEMAKQGWDRPLPEQLAAFFSGLFTRGDLGNSFFEPSRSIASGLADRVPATIELTFVALLIAVPGGIGAGILAAVYRGAWPDYLTMTLALLGVSVPVFFLGILMLTIFSGMPTGQRLPVTVIYESRTGLVLLETLFTGRFGLFYEALRHICLPAIALSTIPMAIIARVTRSSMLEVLSADYIRTARAKGASWWQVVLRHAFPNVAVPITNIAGFQTGMLLTGAVLTETVFSWPGLGSWLFDAVKNADYAVVQGGALVIAAMFVTLNLLLDLLYMWLDPRVRLA